MDQKSLDENVPILRHAQDMWPDVAGAWWHRLQVRSEPGYIGASFALYLES